LFQTLLLVHLFLITVFLYIVYAREHVYNKKNYTNYYSKLAGEVREFPHTPHI